MNASEETHIEPQALAAYLDGHATADEARRIEAHLSTCNACRAEAAATFQTVESLTRPRGRVSTAVGVSAAAAIVVLVGIPVLRSGGQDTPIFRSPQAPAAVEGVPRMAAHHPPDRRTVPNDSVLFVWEARAVDAVYRFTLTDDAGDVLWRTTTTDTLLMPDDAIALAPDRDYFWIVDALYEGGRSATTGANSFRVQRE